MGVDVTFLAEGDGKSSEFMPCDGVVRSADGWCRERSTGVRVSHVFQILSLRCLRHNDVITGQSLE